MTAGAGLSSAAIGGAVPRRSRPVRAAPLSGRGGGVDGRTCADPLRPLQWPGLPRQLAVCAVQHHGEEGQPGGEYLRGRKQWADAGPAAEERDPCSSRPGLRVGCGPEGPGASSPSCPPPRPHACSRRACAARCWRLWLGPTLSACSCPPLSSTAPTSPHLSVVLPGWLASLPYWDQPCLFFLIKELQELRETCLLRMLVESLRPVEAPGLAPSSGSRTPPLRSFRAHLDGVEASNAVPAPGALPRPQFKRRRAPV